MKKSKYIEIISEKAEEYEARKNKTTYSFWNHGCFFGELTTIRAFAFSDEDLSSEDLKEILSLVSEHMEGVLHE